MNDFKMVKAHLQELEGAGHLEFSFNPTEYTVKKSTNWNAPQRNMKSDAGSPQDFVGTSPQTISMQIFFDDWESPVGDVTKQVELLFNWCQPSKLSIVTKKPQPPELAFIWGSNLQLSMRRWYLESVSVKYTMFGRTGNPLRATADITLKESAKNLLGQNPTSGSIQARKTHLVSDGDSLQSIATAEYGNPNFWRGLATFNDIDDPLRLKNGDRLLVPSIDEAASLSKRN